MTDPIDRFAINTSNYLGLDYQSHKNDLYSTALVEPAKYFRIRKNTLEIVKNQAIANIYKSFYNLLLKGEDIDGNPIPDLDVPAYPAQEVSKTLDSLLSEIVKIILPVDFQQLASRRMEEKSKQNF